MLLLCVECVTQEDKNNNNNGGVFFTFPSTKVAQHVVSFIFYLFPKEMQLKMIESVGMYKNKVEFRSCPAVPGFCLVVFEKTLNSFAWRLLFFHARQSNERM